MDIQMTGKSSFFVYLNGSELERLHLEPESVGQEETELILNAAMRQLGKDDPGSASFEVYPGRNDLLVFIRLCPDDTVFYKFDNFELTLEAARRCPTQVPSALVYYDNSYILSLENPDTTLLTALSELGCRLTVRGGFLSHAAEHGRVLIDSAAVQRLQTEFHK